MPLFNNLGILTGSIYLYKDGDALVSSSRLVISPDFSNTGKYDFIYETTGSTPIKLLTLSSSGTDPRVGIGNENPQTTLDIKDVSDTAVGAEILIRSARTTKGGDVGDAAGKILFVIDSGSYSDIKTSGSVATITSEVTFISSEGVAGDLILKSSNIDKNEPSEVLRINNDTSIFSSSLNVKGQLLTLSSSLFAVISTTINSDADTNVNAFSTSVYKGGFYDYTLMSTSGSRIGQFMVLSGSGGVTFTDVSAPSIGGDTAEPSLSAFFSGGAINVRITNGSGYTFKAIRRLL